VINGDGGAIVRFVGFTLLRALLIAPGIALAGIRGKQLVYGSLAASGAISAVSLGYAWAVKDKPAAAKPVGPLPNTPPPSSVVDAQGEQVDQQVAGVF
jgi:hypothetical protein